MVRIALAVFPACIVLACISLAACGAERLEVVTGPPHGPDPAGAAAPAETPRRAADVEGGSSRAPTSLTEVAQAVDMRLAGLRGEAARAYARKLLERAVPADAAARRDVVLAALTNGNPTVRWVALLAVPGTGAIDDAMFRVVLRQTQAAEPYLHVAAHEALTTADGIDPGAAERMWRVAATAPAGLRAAIYRALGTHRASEGRKATLRVALADEAPEVRRAAAFALLQLLPMEPPPAHPHADLVEDLGMVLANDADPGVRVYAANALARMGLAASPAAPQLAGALGDDSGRVRSGACSALVGIGDAGLPVLRSALGRGDPAITEAVAYLLRRIATPASLALLREGLAAEDPFIRGRFAMALHAMNSKDADVLVIYQTLLRHEDGDVVLLALEGLGQLGAEAEPAVHRVRPLLQHADPRVCIAAAVLLDFLVRR